MATMNAGSIAAAGAGGGYWDRFRAFFFRLLRALRQVNLTGLAAQVSYSLIFSMPSILLIIALVANTIDQRTGFALSEEVRDFIVEALPVGVQPVVTGLVNDAMHRAREGPSTISAIIAILVALLAAGNGLGELATAFDRAAGIDDDRPPWVKRFVFTASAVLIAMMLVIAFTLYVWGGDLVDLLSARFGQQGDWSSGWQALQGPVILVLVFVGTTLLYMTSSGCYCFRETAPGAVVATILWLVVIKGFQVYLQIANPGTAYGAASSVLVFLVFLYLSSMGLIIGAMSAAVIVRQSRARGRAKLQMTATLHQHHAPQRAAAPAELQPGGPRYD
jgi:membrane protein